MIVGSLSVNNWKWPIAGRTQDLLLSLQFVEFIFQSRAGQDVVSLYKNIHVFNSKRKWIIFHKLCCSLIVQISFALQKAFIF